MKNVFFVILLSMYSSLIYSQRIQNKIWGCEYGANRADIISVIEKQGFKYIDQGDKIKMDYPVFGGMKFDYGYFYFYLNRMYMCQFSVDFREKGIATSFYNCLKDNLSRKYGFVEDFYSDESKITLYDDNINGIKLDQINLSLGGVYRYGVNLVYCNWIILKEVTNEM